MIETQRTLITLCTCNSSNQFWASPLRGIEYW